MRLVLGISAGSALELSFCFIKNLPKHIELFIALTDGAIFLAQKELGIDLEEHLKSLGQVNIYKSLDSKLASGSFLFDACIILPTSSNTLASIALGVQDNLLTRIGNICLKERRFLILAVREMPLSAISLGHMSSLASLGVSIAPPIVGFYGLKSSNLESMSEFFIGKYFDLLKIEHNLFKRWNP